MSESYREQHPLLCEELSEEDQFGQQYPRRFRPIVCRGRSKNQAKGAVNIITQWPDHWTTSATNWWIALGMIALTVFVIYNSIVAFALLPVTSSKPTRQENSNYSKDNNVPTVFMHLLVNNNDEVDLNKYLPYLEKFGNKYVDYKYKLIIVLNDTNSESNPLSAEENNEIALNSLWSNENDYAKMKSVPKNIKIKHVLLSTIMNKSPLKKYWRHLPQKLMGFLLRAVAIWDKGGIAFNPDIITPWSPHHVYHEKVDLIFQKYNKCQDNNNKTVPKQIYPKKQLKQNEKMKKKVNNIQDIIDILEHEDESTNASQDSLTEAENKQSQTVVSGRKLLFFDNHSHNDTDKNVMNVLPRSERYVAQINNTEVEDLQDGEIIIQDKDILIEDRPPDGVALPSENNNTMKLSLLPLFLEFLFHDKSNLLPDIDVASSNSVEKPVSRQRKSVIPVGRDNDKSELVEILNQVKNDEKTKPMILSAKGIMNVTNHNTSTVTNNITPVKCDASELTIDLKGNILATRTSCHAFIGTIFTNVIHYTDKEDINDFIIAELSMFCKGLLSTCNGIDVIFL